MKLANSIRRLASLVTMLALAACAATPHTVNESLDPLTGVTVLSASAPLMLYRDNPSRAAYARNFIQLGPIEINRTGNYRYYLWLGAWSTMQPTGTTTAIAELDSITLFVDGEPFSIELAGSTPAAIGTSKPVYLKPVATSIDAYYEVTIDQIRLISEASDIRLRTTGTSPKEFQLWDSQQSAQRSIADFVKSALL